MNQVFKPSAMRFSRSAWITGVVTAIEPRLMVEFSRLMLALVPHDGRLAEQVNPLTKVRSACQADQVAAKKG